MAGPASSLSSPNLCQTFQEKLARHWKHRAACGRHYIDRAKLIAWMNRVDTDEAMTNAGRLIGEVYCGSRRVPFLPSAKSISTDDDDRSLLVFSILLELGRGDLVDLFQKAKIIDNNLESSEYYYDDLRADLKRNHIHDADGVVDDFERAKWSFCPAVIKHGMRSKFHRGKWVLPFCKRERINEKGGTAELWQILIQEDFVHKELRDAINRSRVHDREFGWCYQLALKSYPSEQIDVFEWERIAFVGLRGQKGMVQYLGDYSFDDTDDRASRTYNILLEFGELDLDEFFADKHSYPPVLTPEIVDFWQSLFEVAEALKRFHNLEYRNDDGVTAHYHGWHADLKPDNVLRVHGEFKLADFGFAKFKQRSKEMPTEFIEGGTETYGPPETDNARRQRGTRTPVTQTIDTWSFGCVLSITATWVVLGFQGIRQFQTLRMRAIKKLHEQQALDELPIPTADDAFHNGREVLPEVLHWHSYLCSIMRTSDTVTRRVLGLVEGKMLCADPGRRITSSQLCKELGDILFLARRDRSNALATGETKETDKTVLEALLEFDKKAPSNVVEAAKAKVAGAVQQKAQGMTNGKIEAKGGISLAVPPDRQPRKSKRIGKSERLDNIPLAKTANRTKMLEVELKGHDNVLTTTRNAHNSFVSDTANGDLPTVCESPIEDEAAAVAGPGKTRERDFPSPSGQLERPPIQSKDGLGASQNPDRPPPGTSGGPAVTGSNPHRSERQTLRGPAIQPPSIVREPPSAAPEEQSPKSRSPRTSRELHPLTRPSEIAQGKAPVVESQNLVFQPVSPLPIASPSSPVQPRVLDPSFDICKVRMELETNRPKGFGAQAASLIGKTKKDSYLKNFITNRDIKFVVDNGTTMRPFWDVATYVLETLAMKLAGLDKDGLDLVFTIGQDWNIDNARGSGAPTKFRRAMERASPIVPDTPDLKLKTDMCETLGQVFQEYLTTHQKKKMTLLVLTDGIWEGSVRDKAVEKKIATFVEELVKRHGAMEDRRFSIEFIRFGDDANAISRLTGLDDGLEEEFGIPDIIDTVSWTGRVKKMILGSFREDEDEEKDEVPSGSVSPGTPPPMNAGSRGIEYQLPHSSQGLMASPPPRFEIPGRTWTNQTELTTGTAGQQRKQSRLSKFFN